MYRELERKFQLAAKLACFALVLVFALAPLPAAAKGDFKILPSVNRMKLDPQPDYEKTMKEGSEQIGAQAECNSGYRSPEQQREICCKMAGCGCGGCPGRCAPPGRSNHQRVATCDIQKIPGDVKKGCEFLFEMCQKMRSRDNSLQCEIGGYGPGAHHLAVGRGIKPSAYNQCSFLKPKMGMDPGRDQRLQDDANKLERDIMGNNQRPPEQPGQQSPPPLTPPAMYPVASNSPAASYPTPYGGYPTAPTPPMRNDANKIGTAKPGQGRPQVEIDIKGHYDNSESDVTKRKPGEEDGPGSGITGRGKEDLPGAYQAGGGGFSGIENNSAKLVNNSGQSGPGAAKGAGGLGGAGGGLGEAGGASGKRGPDASKNPYGTAGSGTNGEVLASYSGGGSGGRLAPSKVGVAGSDVAAAMTKLQQEFQGDAEGEGATNAREPASAEERSSAGNQEAASLFDRMHDAHLRCLRRGCVSRAR